MKSASRQLKCNNLRRLDNSVRRVDMDRDEFLAKIDQLCDEPSELDEVVSAER